MKTLKERFDVVKRVPFAMKIRLKKLPLVTYRREIRLKWDMVHLHYFQAKRQQLGNLQRDWPLGHCIELWKACSRKIKARRSLGFL